MSLDESLRGTEKMVDRAVANGLKVSVTIGASFGCPFEGEVSTERVMDIVNAVDRLNVDEIALADTIGVGTPPQVRRLVSAAQEVTRKPLRLHLHNTRNTGYANAFAALEAGVESLDSSSGGIGGCPFAPNATGNIATEDLAYLMERSGSPVGIDFDRLLEATNYVTAKLGIATPALLGRAGWFPAEDFPTLVRDQAD